MRPTALSRLGLTTVIVLAALSYRSVPAGACSCAPSGPPCDATWRASAVFVGEAYQSVRSETGTGVEYVRGLRIVNHPVLVPFKVLEAFRGDVRAIADVYTADNTAACGFAFSLNLTYLVYAHERDGRLVASICSRTKLASAAGADLAYLRGAARSGVDMSRIEGEATRYPDVFGDFRTRPFANGRIQFRSLDIPDAPAFEALTGPDGRYSIRMPPGRYSAALDVPDGLYVLPPEPVIHLLDARGCREANFAVYSNGRVGGRVVDARGDPVPFFGVEIISARAAAETFFRADDRVVTDANGRYEFARLRSDTYLVGLDIRKEGREPPAGITWLLNAAGATLPIHVPSETRVSAPDFRLPNSIELAEVAGRFVDENGGSIAGAEVYLDPGTCCARESAVRTANDGTFRLTAIAGRRYTVLASIWRGSAPVKTARSAPFVAAKGLQPLELRLK